jgi:probable rRNA maturation factor
MIQLEIINHQEELSISDDWLLWMQKYGLIALGKVKNIQLSDSVLYKIKTIEVAIVDKETSAKVHVDFMGIEGETDVITFPHGEIIICAEVARIQAIEHEQSLKLELFRYLVHGLLHLAGYNDIDPKDQSLMFKNQESIILELCVS